MPPSIDRERKEGAAAACGELTARPRPGDRPAAEPGLHPLGLGAARDGLVHVPASYWAERPAPLAMLLHGAGGEARQMLPVFAVAADLAGMILLLPDSRGQSWDVIRGSYGPDVRFIDAALKQVFERCRIDPARIAVGGFSDGASYALSLGLVNGGLFSHVLALSPGFMAPTREADSPRFFIAHGTDDPVLPIDRCSRRLVPLLRRAGYDVLYREFAGGHEVPPAIAREAIDWFFAGG